MSYIITGSEDQNSLAIHHAVTTHMLSKHELLTVLRANCSKNYLEYYNGGYSVVLSSIFSRLEWLKVECGVLLKCLCLLIYYKLLSTLTMQLSGIGLLVLLRESTKCEC